MTDWKCSENSSLKKKGKSEEYQDINNAIWSWFCMAREALIPVSGPMIQEEALQIASKLNVAEFTALNAETLESWAEQLREIVKGYELKIYEMLMKQDFSGVHYRINHFQYQKVDVKAENMPNNG